jgi:hypothetical protein
LLAPEISPTVVMDEDEKQDNTERNLDDAQRIEPFPETNLNVMLYTETDEVIVKDKCPVHPTELVSYGKHGNQNEPQE